MLVTPAFVVVEAGGVGYKCTVTTQTIASLPEKDKDVTLLTYMYIREDALELFGFAAEQELTCFKLLINITGVGPKAAIAILSNLSPSQLMTVVASGDAKALTKAPGVGPKLAQRIIMELADKVGTAAGITDFGISKPIPGQLVGKAPTPQSEAVSALIALGYGQADAAAAVARLDPSLPVDELIKQSLRALARGV